MLRNNHQYGAQRTMERRRAHGGLLSRFLAAITLVGCGLNGWCLAALPNVLLILTDDQGYGDIQSHGNPVIQTPVLDALAESGARFERFFVSPVCAPTRASLLTGRYHLRTGVHGVTRGWENLNPEEVTLAELLRDAGYATGAFGKWHNGRHMPYHPNGQGFDEFFGFCGGHWNTYFDPPLEHNGKAIETQGYIADVLTDAAIDFISEHDGAPWFCYVPYNTPHSPWRVPEENWERFEGLDLDAKARCAYAMVERLDWNVGRLLETLDRLDRAHDTIVLFLTDNGANSPRFNAGMKGRKGSVDEGGTRVPLFVRYPPAIEPGTVVKPIAFHLDLLPTVAELCGVRLSDELVDRLDGRSLVPLLTSTSDPEFQWPERLIVTDTFRGSRPLDRMRAAVRTDRWRATMQKGTWRLYDMEADPGQTRDVAEQHPAVVRRLRNEFDAWFEEIDPQALPEPRVPIGHHARRRTELPANEAMLHPGRGEGIRYTGDTEQGYANSWIHGWTSPEAYPEWNVEVLTPGTYRVEVRYTCPAEAVGTHVTVECGDNEVSATVNDSYDPPLMAKPDYVFSKNYQDKEGWAILDLGVMRLSRGETFLRVRARPADSKAGTHHLIDLKGVRLQRVDDVSNQEQ